MDALPAFTIQPMKHLIQRFINGNTTAVLNIGIYKVPWCKLWGSFRNELYANFSPKKISRRAYQN